jgi:hypothetical protein
MKAQLKRLARRLRAAAIECHHRGMRPASEWLDDFAIDVECMLVEVRLGEQVELVRRERVQPRFTSTELQGAEYVQHLSGRCDLQTCLFHLAEAHVAGKCTAGCRWCAAQRPHLHHFASDWAAGELQALCAALRPDTKIEFDVCVDPRTDEAELAIWVYDDAAPRLAHRAIRADRVPPPPLDWSPP